MNQHYRLVTLVSILFLQCGITWSANNNELDFEAIKDKLKDKIDLNQIQANLPGGIHIPNDLLNNTSIEDTTKMFKEKCIKVSGSDAAYEEATQGIQKLTECISNLVNVTVLQEEIEKATPIGDLDTVFNKYCRKRETAIQCVKNFTDTIDPCLEPQERENKKIMIDIFTSLVSFVCHKDGDQIALFFSEKGPECFQEKQDAIVNCVNSTFKGYLPEEAPKSIDDVPVLTFGEKECSDMSKLQRCVVEVLEDCQESTPANLVDSMFRFVRNKTPCANMTSTVASKQAGGSTGGASFIHITWFTLAMAFFFSKFI